MENDKRQIPVYVALKGLKSICEWWKIIFSRICGERLTFT